MNTSPCAALFEIGFALLPNKAHAKTFKIAAERHLSQVYLQIKIPATTNFYCRVICICT